MSSAFTLKDDRFEIDDDNDPYRFGWRFVERKLANGKKVIDQVPLTLADLLHPKVGDVLVENSAHERDRRYLQSVFEERLADDPSALSLSDCRIKWDIPRLKSHSPDISLIFGVRRRRRSWTTFYVARQGVRPKIIIEIVSPDSRVNDVEIKFRHYHEARVPYYVIVDRKTDEGPVEVFGYRYTPTRYVRMPRDERGRIRLPGLGLLLGVKEDRVVLYDAATDEEVGDYTAISRALATESAARAAAEEQLRITDAARQDAEAETAALRERVRELEERLRRRNGQDRAGP